MRDDYLWDKTGEPDPQIQQLEEVLGTLRYQPKPLALPVAQRRRYFPVLAIAATVLLALLAIGLWFRVRTSTQPPQEQAYVAPAAPTPVEPKPEEPEKVDPPVKVQRNRSNRSAASAASAAKRREREEALAVKQQLIIALRLASEKLNLAHKKARIG